MKKEKEYKKVYRKTIEHPHKSDLKEQTLLDSRAGAEPKVVTRPSHMLIVDDCQGTDYTYMHVYNVRKRCNELYDYQMQTYSFDYLLFGAILDRSSQSHLDWKMKNV